MKSISKHFQFLNIFSTWFQYSNRLSICFHIKYGNRLLNIFFGKSVHFAPHRVQQMLYHLLLLCTMALSYHMIHIPILYISARPRKHIACKTIDEITIKFCHFLNFIFDDNKIVSNKLKKKIAKGIYLFLELYYSY
jgi:hypothetical protein